jgi:hypothetical protein
MIPNHQETITVVHNKVRNRIRFYVPIIKNKQTYALMLKQSLLRNAEAKGIYHAEPNIVTGNILIKYHPAMHTEEDVVRLLQSTLRDLCDGKIDITEKHKNPRLGKMHPGAFFTRELLVSIGGNVVAGLILAFFIAA